MRTTILNLNALLLQNEASVHFVNKVMSEAKTDGVEVTIEDAVEIGKARVTIKTESKKKADEYARQIKNGLALAFPFR